MSQNNITKNNLNTVYAGVDIAKLTLELNLGGTIHTLGYETKDHIRVLKLLAAAEKALSATKVHVILEATGGYEAALVRVLHKAGQPVSVIQPSRIRHFAFAKNQRAKSDPIDARILTQFGEAIRPAPTAAPTTAQVHLSVL